MDYDLRTGWARDRLSACVRSGHKVEEVTGWFDSWCADIEFVLHIHVHIPARPLVIDLDCGDTCSPTTILAGLYGSTTPMAEYHVPYASFRLGLLRNLCYREDGVPQLNSLGRNTVMM